ncbi:MAG: nitrilase-related carbon-nitrogen hydrolase, partial [Planctomycetota bacterium]
MKKKQLRIAITICEDIWNLEWLDAFFREQQIDLIVNISASPFNAGKDQQRQAILADCCRHFNCPVAYCNLVGGQDELVFDGRSMIVNTKGNVILQAKEFCEDLIIADFPDKDSKSIAIKPVSSSCHLGDPLDEIDEIYQALVLGTRDYVRKNGFLKVVIGLSGGIDSALVAAIAVQALGKENVVGITMPSKFNTNETRC